MKKYYIEWSALYLYSMYSPLYTVQCTVQGGWGIEEVIF